MRQAASYFLGDHDFTSFAAVDPEHGRETEGSNVRSIAKSECTKVGHEFVYDVRGNGFLHHMVRNIVGTLILVGKGALPAEDVSRILRERNRSAAGATVPPNGLYLVSVEY